MSTLNDTPNEMELLAMQAIGDWCQQSVVGCPSEHVAKAMILEAYLKARYKIEEGCSGIGKHSRKQLLWTGATINSFPTMRELEKKRSLDVMVVAPSEFKIELQARTSIGSQDAINADPIRDDVGRVRAYFVDAFILVCDQLQYDKLSGWRDPRGRPSATDVMPLFKANKGPGKEEYQVSDLRVRQLTVMSPVRSVRVVTSITRAKPI